MSQDKIENLVLFGIAMIATCVLVGLGDTTLATVIGSGAIGWMSKSAAPAVS